jgi:hypothetical protein
VLLPPLRLLPPATRRMLPVGACARRPAPPSCSCLRRCVVLAPLRRALAPQHPSSLIGRRHTVRTQAFTSPDKTIMKGPIHVKDHNMGGVGGGLISYKLEREDENKKMHSIEIFRNAYAVDQYGPSRFACTHSLTLSLSLSLVSMGI